MNVTSKFKSYLNEYRKNEKNVEIRAHDNLCEIEEHTFYYAGCGCDKEHLVTAK